MLRAEEGLDERPAVGIGIVLRGVEVGEDERAADEGRNVSERERRDEEVSVSFFALSYEFPISPNP